MQRYIYVTNCFMVTFGFEKELRNLLFTFGSHMTGHTETECMCTFQCPKLILYVMKQFGGLCVLYIKTRKV